MPVGISPTWQLNAKGIGNLPVCDVLFSSKSLTFFGTQHEGASNWRDNPAYVPFGLYLENTTAGTPFVDDNTDTWGFTYWLSPATFKRSSLYVSDKTAWAFPFKVWLAEDGPVIGNIITGPPVKKQLIHHFLKSDDPQFTRKMIYDGPDVQMFSGHSYGYLFELDDPVPSLPTSASNSQVLVITMSTVIYYGAAGD